MREQTSIGRLKSDSFWYRYIYPKNLLLFGNEKLVAPEISQGGNFTHDENGDFYSTTTIYGYIKKSNIQESYKCLLAIVNSKVFWWYMVHTGTVLANGYFRYKPNYIKPFPVPFINTDVQKKLEKIVAQILIEKKRFPHADIRELEEQLNTIVYDLYELTKDEIAHIESV